MTSEKPLILTSQSEAVGLLPSIVTVFVSPYAEEVLQFPLQSGVLPVDAKACTLSRPLFLIIILLLRFLSFGMMFIPSVVYPRPL